MSGKVALIIIYNHHQHADNIPLLEKMYRARFPDIYHLVPVMRGFAPSADLLGGNVIPVRGKSFHFHGYMAQGLRHYFREEYTHYIFIHDDLVLNPGINEDNFRDYLKLEREDTAFLSNFYVLHQRLEWIYTPDAYAYEGRVEPLPAYDEALEKFSAHGLNIKPLSFNWSLLFRGHYVPPAGSFLQKMVSPLRWLKVVLRRLQRLLTWSPNKRKLAYPLVGGFSDMVVVPAASITDFCRYCEAFVAPKLFVLIAVPTALALSCRKVNTHDDIRMRGLHYWPGKTWGAVRSRYDAMGLNSLLENFPDECLFIHPVKLSQWNTDSA